MQLLAAHEPRLRRGESGRWRFRRAPALLRTGRAHADRACPRRRISTANPRPRRNFTVSDEERTQGFGRNCLLARRLLERGVRFVQLFNGGAFGSPRINWDGHENLKENHDNQAATMDKPVAGADPGPQSSAACSKTRWSSGTPSSAAARRRRASTHPAAIIIPTAFTCFLAGAGVKKGFQLRRDGRSRLLRRARTRSRSPTFHATILHLLGIDHEKLTFYHNGINRRLTDVHGKVIEGILA